MSKISLYLTMILTGVSMIFGGFSIALKVLIIMMVIDYSTGVIDGVLGVSVKSEHGALSSKIGFKGIVKKFYMLLIVAVGYQLDNLLGLNYIRELIIYSFIINEIISLLENIGAMGIQYPNILDNAIDLLKGKAEHKEG